MKAFLAAAIVVTSAPLIAAQSGGPAVQSKEEPRICRRIVSGSQTRLHRQRVCLTATQWNARSEMSADEAMGNLDPRTRTQGRPVTKGIGGPGG
jgi:hypothetical protein